MVFIIQKDAYEASSVGQPRTENVEMDKPYSLLLKHTRLSRKNRHIKVVILIPGCYYTCVQKMISGTEQHVSCAGVVGRHVNSMLHRRVVGFLVFVFKTKNILSA